MNLSKISVILIIFNFLIMNMSFSSYSHKYLTLYNDSKTGNIGYTLTLYGKTKSTSPSGGIIAPGKNALIHLTHKFHYDWTRGTCCDTIYPRAHVFLYKSSSKLSPVKSSKNPACTIIFKGSYSSEVFIPYATCADLATDPSGKVGDEHIAVRIKIVNNS